MNFYKASGAALLIFGTLSFIHFERTETKKHSAIFAGFAALGAALLTY